MFKGIVNVSEGVIRNAEAPRRLFIHQQTNVVVECPPGCVESSKSKVYGAGGVYADVSSVCKAAAHAGLIKAGGLVNVSLESGQSSYEGSSQNGIVSQSLNRETHLHLVDLVAASRPPTGAAPSSRMVTRSIRLGPVNKV